MSFEKAKAYILQQIRRRRTLDAMSKHPCPNPGTMHFTGWGDSFGGGDGDGGDEKSGAVGAVIISKRLVDPETGERGEWETLHADFNLVVTQAERLMADMAIGVANSPINYIELGDPSPTATPVQLNDVGLEQTTGERKAAVLTVNGNVVTAEVTFLTTDANGFTFTESGLFTGPFGAGSMFARKTFSGIFKTAAFEMKFQWLITFLVNTQGGDCAGIALTGPSTIASSTIFVSPAGGEASVAATFDFVPNSNLIDVFLNGVRLEVITGLLEKVSP